MKIRFNKTGCIIYSLILTACIIFASFYGGLLPFVMLYGIILIIPVSILYNILNYRFLSVYQELDSHRVVKGDMHKLDISINNEGYFPIRNMELILHSDRCDFEGINNGQLISIEPGRKIKIAAKAACRYAGAYYIGISQLEFSDPLGMITCVSDVPYTFRAIVSPQITDSANSYMDIENIINSIGRKSDKRYEETPGNDMRNYYPGDPIKSINWKVSARLDTYMVRVPERMDTRRITLIMEAADVPERMQDTEFLKRRDYFLEFAVSAAWYFAGRGMPVSIIYPAGKITEKQIASYEDFHVFYSDVSGGLSYRSEDEKERMHKLVQERRDSLGRDETSVIIIEDKWPGEGFCVVAG